MNQDHPETDLENSGAAEQHEDQLVALRGELELVKADALRERADLENQRKRMARDVEQARKFANEKLLAELLSVIDNLERGLAVETADAGA